MAQIPKSCVPIPVRLDDYRWATPLPIPDKIVLGAGVKEIHMAPTSAPHQFAVATGTRPAIIGKAWGYGPAGQIKTPGPVLIAEAHKTSKVKWKNDLPKQGTPGSHYPFHESPRNLSAAMMMDRYYRGHGVVHLHGAHVPWEGDGYSMRLPKTNSADYENLSGHIAVTRPGQSFTCVYPNTQSGGATLWYHDHVMDRTARNVYAGLAGMYWIRHKKEADFPVIPTGAFEIPLVLQDRSFVANDANEPHLFYGDAVFLDGYLTNRANPTDGMRSTMREWVQANPPMAEFKGMAPCINGAIWPHVDVEPRAYRFRIVNGANTRFFVLRVSPEKPAAAATMLHKKKGNRSLGSAALPIWQIGSDGGFLPAAVKLDGKSATTLSLLVLAPGERADIIIDFSSSAGQSLYLTNHATDGPPFGIGGDLAEATWADGQLIGLDQLMRFNVKNLAPKPAFDPNAMNAALSTLYDPPAPLPAVPEVRNLIIKEFADILQSSSAFKANGASAPPPIEPSWAAIPFQRDLSAQWDAGLLWGGTPPDAAITGGPPPSGGPIVEAQDIYGLNDPAKYWDIYNISADIHPIHIHHTQFQVIERRTVINGDVKRLGPASGPDPNEAGWKDTVRANKGERIRLAVRFHDAGDASNSYKGNYVFHCHLLEHEDMGMMRPVRIN